MTTPVRFQVDATREKFNTLELMQMDAERNPGVTPNYFLKKKKGYDFS